MPLNIAVILPSLANKAPVQVAKDLAVGLIELGANVEVFYFDDVLEVEFPCQSKRLRFFSRIEFEKFDVVHAHMIRPDAYVWFWRMFRKYKKTTFVSTIHNIVEKDLYFQYGKVTSIIFSRLWRLFWAGNDHLVVLNREAQTYYFQFLGGRKTTVIHNGRKLSRDMVLAKHDRELVEGLKVNYKLIGCCALLTQRKGIDQLIKALPDCEDYALVVVGNGKALPELQELANHLGVMNRCRFLGFKENAQAFLPLFDVYAMPSRSEGLPLALIEAAGNGLATVCSNIEPFREVFTSEEVSFFEIENQEDLVRAIEFAYKNKSVFSEKIYSRYLSSYTSEIMTLNYFNYFNSICHSSLS